MWYDMTQAHFLSTLTATVRALPTIVGLLSTLVFFSTPLFAEAGQDSQTLDELRLHKASLLAQIAELTTTATARIRDIENLLQAGAQADMYLLYLSDAAALGAAHSDDLRRELEAARVDKELGGGASGSGGTSLVDKGGIPKVLSFAVENGALTRERSGTTITFRGNPAGLVKALNASAAQPQSVLAEMAMTPPISGSLTRLAFGFSLDASRGSQNQEAVFFGNEQQLSAVSAKYEILNRRDPANTHYQRRVRGLFASNQDSDSVRAANTRLMTFEQDFVRFLQAAYTFGTWQREAAAALSGGPTMATIDAELERLADVVLALEHPDTIRMALAEYGTTYSNLLRSRDAMLRLAGKGAVLSVEYVHDRPLNEAKLSTFKMIYEVGVNNGKVDLTANASVTLSHSSDLMPDNGGSLRDWVLAGQMDVPLGSIFGGRSLVFSAAGRFQRLLAPSATMLEASNMTMDATSASAIPGEVAMPVICTHMGRTLAVAQAKLTIPVKDSGVKIPISVTVANHPRLIQERIVRGQIGMTLNLDSFFGD